jgi:prepilin-type N-terminal cleavage/methylation domain-containing protein
MKLNAQRAGFTLVEMLVVVAIIVILAAILIPVANGVVRNARNATIGFEISQIDSAVNTFRSAHGGLYPPSFGEAQAAGTTYAAIYTGGTWQQTRLGRYIMKAFPKASARDVQYLFTQVADNQDQSTALIYWLTQTSEDVRYPFTGPTKKSYLAVDETRLITVATIAGDASVTPPIPALTLNSYKPKNAGESVYLYIEASHYPLHCIADLSQDQSAATAAGTGARTPDLSVRPFLKLNLQDNNSANLKNYVNSDTYQLFCAGLDARFSANNAFLRKFPCGANGLDFSGNQFTYDVFADDRDNITNFSEGKPIADVPMP